jgi:hypothetical protein
VRLFATGLPPGKEAFLFEQHRRMIPAWLARPVYLAAFGKLLEEAFR